MRQPAELLLGPSRFVLARRLATALLYLLWVVPAPLEEVMQPFGPELDFPAQEERFGSRAAVAQARQRAVATCTYVVAHRALLKAQQAQCGSPPGCPARLGWLLGLLCCRRLTPRREPLEALAFPLAAAACLRGMARRVGWSSGQAVALAREPRWRAVLSTWLQAQALVRARAGQ